MSNLVGNHIVGFPTRRLKLCTQTIISDLSQNFTDWSDLILFILYGSNTGNYIIYKFISMYRGGFQINILAASIVHVTETIPVLVM